MIFLRLFQMDLIRECKHFLTGNLVWKFFKFSSFSFSGCKPKNYWMISIGSSKFKRPRRSKNIVQNVSHVHPHVLEVDSPEGTQQSADYLQDTGIRSSHGPVRYPMRSEAPNGFSGLYFLFHYCQICIANTDMYAFVLKMNNHICNRWKFI